VASLARGARSWGVVELGKGGKGKDTVACPGWLARRGHRRGDAAMGVDVALGVAVEGYRGLSPLGRSQGGHTGAPWLDVRASRRPGHPITRALVRSGIGEKVRREEIGDDRLGRRVGLSPWLGGPS
jgi:hypothetical protein